MNGLNAVNISEAAKDAQRLDALIFSAASGSSEALGHLYDATSAAVYGFALSILKNTHDAEDALQDCYLAVSSAAGSYSSSGKPMAWIISITRNICLYKLRQRRRDAGAPPEDWENYLSACQGMDMEDRMVLGECMNRLSDQERQIVMLHAVAGFKHREIGELLGLSLPAVLSKYNRAMKKLRKYL